MIRRTGCFLKTFSCSSGVSGVTIITYKITRITLSSSHQPLQLLPVFWEAGNHAKAHTSVLYSNTPYLRGHFAEPCLHYGVWFWLFVIVKSAGKRTRRKLSATPVLVSMPSDGGKLAIRAF